MAKKSMASLLLIAGLGVFSWGWAQTAGSDLFDVKRSERELEIMKGILKTTVGFFVSELQARENPDRKEASLREGMWSSNISAYYLYGQGATFIIPTSTFESAFRRQARYLSEMYEPELLEEAQLQYSRAMREASERVRDLNRDLQRQTQEYAIAAREFASTLKSEAPASPPEPPAPPAPPAVAQPPAPAPEISAEVHKRLAQAQEKVKQRREEFEAQRQKLAGAIREVRAYLVEAMANHGDSLTHVKPEEYINIILTPDEGFLITDRSSESKREVLSIKKSIITDYKAGRLTLEALKQRVYQYTN